MAKENEKKYSLLFLLTFIWHLVSNSGGASCVRVKVLSIQFSKELTWTQQIPRDSAPLYVIWVKVLSNDFSTELTWTQQIPRDSAPLTIACDQAPLWEIGRKKSAGEASRAGTPHLHYPLLLIPH